MTSRPAWHRELSGALADLGILIPIVTALVLVAGMDPGTVFVGVGALYLFAGHHFRVPMPVQPVKAAAALVIAKGLPAEQLAVAGLVLGAILIVVARTGLADQLARIFAPPIVRGLQLGVGLLLVRTAFKQLDGSPLWMLLVAGVIAVVLVDQSRRPSPLPVALIVVAGGILVHVAVGGASATDAWSGLALWRPAFNEGIFDPALLWSALVVLVIPQLPLTFGNAVVGLVDVQHRHFGDAASRVNLCSVGMSMGVANVAVGAVGGMPMCHGSGGFTAHVRAGARTSRMNVIIGAPLLLGGLLLGPTLLALLGLVPVAVLAGLLAFTGVTHATLVADQRGYGVMIAVTVGIIGLLTSNLAWAMAAGLVMHQAGRQGAPWSPRSGAIESS